MEILFALLLAAAFTHTASPRGRAAVAEAWDAGRSAARASRTDDGWRQLATGRQNRANARAAETQGKPGRFAWLRRKLAERRAAKASGAVSPLRLMASTIWDAYANGWRRGPNKAAGTPDDDQQPSAEPAGDPECPHTVYSGVRNGPRMHYRCKKCDHTWSLPVNEHGDPPDALAPLRRTEPDPVDDREAAFDDLEIGPSAPQRPTPIRTTPGGTTMTIATATGGEVLSYPQLLAELDAIIAEASAEVEDRKAAAERAKDDADRIDRMVASLGQLELDQESLNKLHAIAETNAATIETATRAAANAEHRHSLAVNTKETVIRKHGTLHEAHMTAGRDAAQKTFYQAS